MDSEDKKRKWRAWLEEVEGLRARLLEWLKSPVGERPPRDLEAMIVSIAQTELAHEVVRYYYSDEASTKEDEHWDWFNSAKTEWEAVSTELKKPTHEKLLEIVGEARTESRSDQTSIERRCSGFFARALFACQFRKPVSKRDVRSDEWGSFLNFVADRFLSTDVLKHARRIAPKEIAQKKDDLCKQLQDDAKGYVIEYAIDPPQSFKFSSLGETVSFFTKRAAWSVVKDIRHEGREIESSDSGQFDEDGSDLSDVPDTWDACQERFGADSADACRLLFLRLLRGPVSYDTEPSACGWESLSNVVRTLVVIRRLADEHIERIRGAGILESQIIDSFTVGHGGEEVGILGRMLRSHVPQLPGCVPPWCADLLASYYFFQLLPADEKFREYPCPPDDLKDSKKCYFWLINFLFNGYHLPRSRLCSPESPLGVTWEEVVSWLSTVDDLVAGHRIIRASRLPAGLGWQQLTAICAKRRRNVDAVKKYHWNFNRQNPPSD